MNILNSRTLKVSAIVLSVVLSSCGEGSDGVQDDKAPAKKAPAGQVIARVNGEEITIHELNNEIARMDVNDTNREVISRSLLKSIVVRKIFEQNAQKSRIDRSPAIMMELERSKSAILAKAYLRSQLSKRPEVSRREAEVYVLDNPHRFANRAYYIFETIVVSPIYLTKEKRDAWEDVTNLDEIESILLAEGIDYTRVPFTTYSEALPAAIRNDMEDIKLKGDVFFVITQAKASIYLFKTSRPAVLSGEDAYRVAEEILAQEKTKEFLVKLEADALATAQVEYLGDYSGTDSSTSKPLDTREIKAQDEAATSKETQKVNEKE